MVAGKGVEMRVEPKKPDTVAEETRRRVMEAVAACGYTPNILARNLRGVAGLATFAAIAVVLLVVAVAASAVPARARTVAVTSAIEYFIIGAV